MLVASRRRKAESATRRKSFVFARGFRASKCGSTGLVSRAGSAWPRHRQQQAACRLRGAEDGPRQVRGWHRMCMRRRRRMLLLKKRAFWLGLRSTRSQLIRWPASTTVPFSPIPSAQPRADVPSVVSDQARSGHVPILPPTSRQPGQA
jgi:hypothetical protein